ncbi:c-type cytochrome biogenesis protein CcmI [Aquamicrobium sp. LC103]|uniref:c-type cytochrome biogenesis protein CcmI n=1 Tax=Aquamicrobium sp. LC103 TaxID=1120658 RepID=UPI00063EB001|nr:c-type cytochrome biogenesis protein CcmI [Aquamicrobium sp. LC103]TKT81243.1 c-type cytochrome biogenesis protein CcmI [Aquamicrobium sp. LC103]
MFFWIAAAVLTLGACLAVLVPLTRTQAGRDADRDHDIEVYRDQLAELDREAARGSIGESEAAEARAEIGRRILRLADQQSDQASSSGGRFTRFAGTAAVLSIPLLSWGVYATIGSPDLPAMPLQARIEQDPEKNTVDELVARAEAHLAENPSDGRGWDVLAPIYYRMGRHQDAVTAYRNAIRLSGVSAARETGLGEALAASSGGLITSDAQAAFERALALDPQFPKARYLLAAAFMQDGKPDQAVAELQRMMEGLPEESPWRDVAQQAMRSVNAEVEREQTATGPTREQVQDAAGMDDADRAAMIEGMVSSLDEKLRANPDDPAGWQRLIQSYVVLGREADAVEALGRGIVAMGSDSDKGAELEAFGASLGLKPGEPEKE